MMKSLVKEKVENAIRDAGFNVPAHFSIAEPPAGMGDWAVNAALIIAGVEKKNPREIADKIKTELEKLSDFEKVEIAGAGFINLTLKKELYLTELRKIIDSKLDYGRNSAGKGEKVNVEYVSANPTGPLHIGNARSGPIGEALANLYKFLGFEVTREFLVNDRGTQIYRFGKSLLHWYEIKSNPDLVFPEDGYPAPYAKEVSGKIQSEIASEIEKIEDREALINLFAKEGLRAMVSLIKEDLQLVGINFDVFTYESDVVASGKPAKIVEELKQSDHTTLKDGAIWFKDPDDPELSDNESVLIKSDEAHSLTYFATDIAYHVDKIDRGAKILIDVWGANHSGHIPRMKAAMKALGYSEDILQIVVYQYVRLRKMGEAVSMGKRLGNFVTLRQVIEAGVAPDAFKYFILAQNSNTPFDFDIELAADTSERNPVYYIKYAHARISSILRKMGENEVKNEEPDLTLLVNEKELSLIKELVKFPELISDIKEDFQIQSLPHFAYKIAGLFHDFYGSCKVISDDEKLTSARLSLVLAVKYILKNSLEILGIEAPEKM